MGQSWTILALIITACLMGTFHAYLYYLKGEEVAHYYNAWQHASRRMKLLLHKPLVGAGYSYLFEWTSAMVIISTVVGLGFGTQFQNFLAFTAHLEFWIFGVRLCKPNFGFMPASLAESIKKDQ